jgi:isopenicillin N synthase-like dioxygenase
MASSHQQHQHQQPPRALPVINIGRLGDKDPAARALVVQDIARACRDRGCFQVCGTGM